MDFKYTAFTIFCASGDNFEFMAFVKISAVVLYFSFVTVKKVWFVFSKTALKLPVSVFSRLTLEKSKDVRPLKIKECPIQIEVKVSNINIRDWCVIIELKVLLVYAVGNILDVENYTDSEK